MPCDLEGEAVSAGDRPASILQPMPHLEPRTENWYALQTYARHEKMIEQRLQHRGITTFLPLVTEVHRWSDRKKVVQLPLFGCYVFARLNCNAERLRVLAVDGVLGLVGSHGEGTSIPDDQIESIKTLVQERMSWSVHPFLKIGQRVRVCSGALEGMEGILISQNGDRNLVISIDAIQRSLAVRVE